MKVNEILVWLIVITTVLCTLLVMGVIGSAFSYIIGQKVVAFLSQFDMFKWLFGG